MLRFRQVTSANLKIGKLSLILAASTFQEIFMNKFYFTLESMDFFSKKAQRGQLTPTKLHFLGTLLIKESYLMFFLKSVGNKWIQTLFN